jgi:hypothetical protein
MAQNSKLTGTGTSAESRSSASGVVVIESFHRYTDAQAAVDSLADRGFPVEHLSVVARDLVLVEQVTGHQTIWRAAAEGVWAGAFVGAVLGFFFGLFDWVEPLVSALVLALWGVILGGVVGAVANGVGHWAVRGRRDFSSVTGMEAGRFDLMADAETATEARALLRQRLAAG